MEDKRAYPRHPVRIEGKLISPDMLCCVDVVIKELSEGGALVSSAVPATFPRNGYLWQAKTGTLFECEVRWRKSNRLFGLRFTDATSRDRLRGLIDACTAAADDRRTGPRYRAMSTRAA
jgi:hypothetical protein